MTDLVAAGERLTALDVAVRSTRRQPGSIVDMLTSVAAALPDVRWVTVGCRVTEAPLIVAGPGADPDVLRDLYDELVPAADDTAARWMHRADDTSTLAQRATAVGLTNVVVQSVWVPDYALHDVMVCAAGDNSGSDRTTLAVATLLAEELVAADSSSASPSLLESLTAQRDIAMATGIVMVHCDVDAEQAHAVLRLCAQSAHRTLPALAADVVQRRDLDDALVRRVLGETDSRNMSGSTKPRSR